MITIFNRRELMITYSMDERVRICDILRVNNIDYTIKTINTTASSFGSSRRASTGTLGLNMDYVYEYIFYVHKKDYDLAIHLIHSSR